MNEKGPSEPSLSLAFERRPPPALDVVRAAIERYLATRPEIRLAYIFGSLATGRAGALSDVDVAVLVDDAVLDANVAFDYQAELVTRLMAVTSFPKIDLAILNRAPSLLRFIVARDGVLLKARNPAEPLTFRVEAIRDYIDFEPVRRIQSRYLRESLGLDRPTEILR